MGQGLWERDCSWHYWEFSLLFSSGWDVAEMAMFRAGLVASFFFALYGRTN
jgi:hypothetical protein